MKTNKRGNRLGGGTMKTRKEMREAHNALLRQIKIAEAAGASTTVRILTNRAMELNEKIRSLFGVPGNGMKSRG